VDQPQSQDVVDRLEAELRRDLDAGLRIRWNPIARHQLQAHWDVNGKRIVNETYEGRWQVGKYGLDELNVERFVVIWTVEWDREREGEYRELGDWLVEFFKKWDSAQAAYLDEHRKHWAEHDEAVARASIWQDEAAALAGLDKMAFAIDGPQFIGRGADFNADDSKTKR
jgi:hypothetical protein